MTARNRTSQLHGSPDWVAVKAWSDGGEVPAEGRTGVGFTRRAPPGRNPAAYRRVVDNSAEVKEFLTTRRAKVSVVTAGLPDVGARRVPGLRRSEVASLAGISVEYYAKLERGALASA